MLRLTLPSEPKAVSLGVPGASVTLRPVTSLDRDAAGLAAAKRVREAESAAAVLSAVLGREVDLPAEEEDRRALTEILTLAEIARRAAVEIKGVASADGKELTVDDMQLADWVRLLMDPIRRELFYFGALEATALLESEGNGLRASSNGGPGEARSSVGAAGS